MRYFVLLNNYATLDLQKHVFLIKSDIRYFFVRSNYVWKLRYSYVALWFFNLLYLFLRQNSIIKAFLLMTFFHDLSITFFCGTFTLRMEITLQLRFVFVRRCEVFFITSQMHYLFRCRYVFLTLELRYILVCSNYV